MMNRRQFVSAAAAGAAAFARVSSVRAATYDGRRTGRQRLFPSGTILGGKHVPRIQAGERTP